MRKPLAASGGEGFTSGQTLGEKAYAEKRFYFASRAIGGYPFVGTPDRIADELIALSRSNIRGILPVPEIIPLWNVEKLA